MKKYNSVLEMVWKTSKTLSFKLRFTFALIKTKIGRFINDYL